MPASTTQRGIPYPVPTDPINAYPSVAKTAAENLDAHTHDKTTVGSAVNADYATNAGNAGLLDGLDSTAFAPTSHGQHIPGYGSFVVACGASGTPGDTGIVGLCVAINGDQNAKAEPMDFVNDSSTRLLARYLLTGTTSLAYLVPTPITNATIRVNIVRVA